MEHVFPFEAVRDRVSAWPAMTSLAVGGVGQGWIGGGFDVITARAVGINPRGGEIGKSYEVGLTYVNGLELAESRGNSKLFGDGSRGKSATGSGGSCDLLPA